ncbi:MAG: FAD-dependent oxidoreductase [Clostridia bacterium]|nr:FAD-dependent oxidoreductase [Clostridia bacterium]
MKKRLVIIGAGPAGLCSAIGATEAGLSCDDILLLEREDELGGVLNQCIHDGFGEYTLGESLTGTEYAERLITEVKKRGIPYLTGSTVLSITPDKEITLVSSTLGYTRISAEAIILAMGCRERSHGSLRIAGTRPAGVFSAGTVQRFINIEGQLPGKKVVLFGSGDIGLVTARRLTIEGAKVLGVYERKPHPTGLDKNMKECLEEFGIPFYTGKTISKILGKERVEGVLISSVDENLKIIKGTEQLVKCDTLVLSLGLIPDNSIPQDTGIALDRVTGGAIVNQRYETQIEGIFACGNALHIHDYVDHIAREATKTGINAGECLLGKIPKATHQIKISHNKNVKYTVPQKIDFPLKSEEYVTLSYRSVKVVKNAKISVLADDEEIYTEALEVIRPSRQHKIRLTSDMLEKISKASVLALNVTEE